MATALGTELIVDARGCRPEALRSRASLAALLAEIVEGLDLCPVGEAWHEFPEPGGGVTGLLLLSESHLTVHTFPERGVATLNLYCCRRRPEWPWATKLAAAIGATEVDVRRVGRA